MSFGILAFLRSTPIALRAPDGSSGRSLGTILAQPRFLLALLAGLLLIAAAAAVGLNGTSVPHFWVALVLLGIGWNFGFIGATALVGECCRPEERPKTQAMNDFLVFGCVAVASFSSGSLVTAGGWSLLNWIVLPVVAVTLTAIIWGMSRHVFAAPEPRLT